MRTFEKSQSAAAIRESADGVRTFDKIDAVIKVTERCNINCTYCYMFNKGSDLFESKPKKLSTGKCIEIADFLRDGAIAVEAKVVRIIFHGGEPLMVTPQIFDAYCDIFLRRISDVAEVKFNVQTNAMLVTDAWIAVFEKYGISVGISLDGNKQVNDTHRIDHKGRGTYLRSIAGAKRLFNASLAGRLPRPAVLCVINTDENGGSVFNHFVGEIGFKWIDFLLPIETRDSFTDDEAADVGRFLKEAFDAWVEYGDKDINVRFFDNFYTFMTGFDRSSGAEITESPGTLILTISTDGTYGPDDTLRVIGDYFFEFNISNTPIGAYLKSETVEGYLYANRMASDDCADCIWVGYCVSGSANGRAVNRYAQSTGFSRKSAVCRGLNDVYSHLASQLVNGGYPRTAMYERLDNVATNVLSNS